MIYFTISSVFLKTTDIIRRADDLGRIVIPKEIQRTLRIKAGDPLLKSLTPFDQFLRGMIAFLQRIQGE